MGSVVRLNDRPYYMDRRQFARGKAKDYRNEPDPGERQAEERGVKANEIWLRVWNDFSLGCGQELADKNESNPRRFRQSINFDPFSVYGELSVPGSLEPYLEEPDMIDAMSNPLGMISNGVDILVYGDQSIPHIAFYGNREEGFENVPDLIGGHVDATVWGNEFWLIRPSGIIHRLEKFYDENVLIPPVFIVEEKGTVPSPANCIEYALGRIIVGCENKLYEFIPGGTPNHVLIYQHPNPNFVWWGIEESSQGIYAWGFEQSNYHVFDAGVFFMTAEEYNGSLAPPYKVLPLPEGEFVVDLLFYGGYVFLATNHGIRMSQVNELGYLVYGPALEVPGASALYGRGENIYFGFDKYYIGGASSAGETQPYWGVGVIKLRELVDNLTPPFAMVYASPGIGSTWPYPQWPTVTHIGLDKDDEIFVTNVEMDEMYYINEANRAREGIIRLGFCSFGTAEQVRILGVGLKGHTTGTNQILYKEGVRYLHTDPAGFAYKGEEILLNQQSNVDEDNECDIRTRRSELALEYSALTFNEVDSAIYQIQLEATPIHYYAEKFVLPFFFADWVRDDYNIDVSLDLEAEWQILNDLMNNRTFVDLELGQEKFRGFVQSLEMKPETLMEFSRPFENPDSLTPQHQGMSSGFIYVTFHSIPGYPPQS